MYLHDRALVMLINERGQAVRVMTDGDRDRMAVVVAIVVASVGDAAAVMLGSTQWIAGRPSKHCLYSSSGRNDQLAKAPGASPHHSE